MNYSRATSKFKCLMITPLLLALVVLLLLYYASKQDKTSFYVELSEAQSTTRNKTKTILLWNSFFHSKSWYLPEKVPIDEKYFAQIGCPDTNCHVTWTKDNPDTVAQYDAVVFHAAREFDQPIIRNPHQVYVYTILESPIHTYNYLKTYKNFFNMTMTYRLDSDIIWSYGIFKERDTGAVVAPSRNPTWRQPSEVMDEEYESVIKNKSALAAWFVSNCETNSRRESLVRKLQKFITVDVYGKCGPLKCPHGSSECDNKLDKDYKFYFSLENSLCVDYVTEKFYNALKRQLIPVVFGGADYNRFAPPHSYIDVNQFKTVQDLADYLLHLSSSPKLYQQYFWWRKYYTVTTGSHFCTLCSILNDPGHEQKTQMYSNVEDWWVPGKCNFKPRINFS